MDVIPAIWCPKSRVDAASQFVNKSLKQQPLDLEIGSNNTNRDNSLLKGGTSREDLGFSNDSYSFEISADCKTEMQNNGHHSLQNSIVNCKEITCNNKQRTFSLLNGYNQDSQENSHFTANRLPSMFETDKLKTINKVHSYSCPSSKKHVSASNSDSLACCGSYACLKNSAKSSSADACSSVRHIQEELKEIKREVENLHSSYCCDGNLQDVNKETFCRRRRRPRRRGRGNWQYGADYKASMDEVKGSSYPHDCSKDKELSLSLHRPYRIDDESERGKVGFCISLSDMFY